MTEEEKREEGLQPEQSQPETVLRPIEVEVNLLRRKLGGLVFLVLVLTLCVLAVMVLMYRYERNKAMSLQNQVVGFQRESRKIIFQAQNQRRALDVIVLELDKLRKTNPEVAAFWKKHIAPLVVSPSAPRGVSAEETAAETEP